MNNKKGFYFDPSLAHSASNLLRLLLYKRPLVVLCIGSDKLVGDSLGPMCGHYLKHAFDAPCFVYGDLDHPVHALNLKETYQYITTNHKNSLVIAIDSMIGNTQKVGKCKIIYGPIHPGSVDGKQLPACGDLSLTGIISDKLCKNALSNTIRLGTINKLAFALASVVALALAPQKTKEHIA